MKIDILYITVNLVNCKYNQYSYLYLIQYSLIIIHLVNFSIKLATLKKHTKREKSL